MSLRFLGLDVGTPRSGIYVLRSLLAEPTVISKDYMYAESAVIGLDAHMVDSLMCVAKEVSTLPSCSRKSKQRDKRLCQAESRVATCNSVETSSSTLCNYSSTAQ